MSADSDGDPIEKAIGMCTMVQSMIDFTAKNLYGLRTRCATTEEITQKEIRDTETKLIKLFSRQLVAKAKLAPDEIPEKLAEYPKTDQWLIVVGIHPDIVKEVMERGVTIDTLLDMSEVEVRNFLRRYHTDDDDYEDAANKLSVALQNLKQWTERQLQGDKGTDSEVDLHWTSYYHKSTSSSPFSGSSPKHGQRPSTSSLPPDTYLNTPGSPAPSPGPTLPTPPQSTPSSPAPRTSGDKYRYTPPPTPPLARAKATSSSKYPSTPPPKRKIQLAPDAAFPLTKSKSHESQLANRVTDVDATNKYLASTSPRTQKKKPHNLKIGGSYEALNRRRLSTDGSEVGSISSHAPSGHMSPAVSSPIRSPPFKQQDLPTVFDDFSKPNTLTVPRSPKTFYGPRMLHSINHRFTSTFQITTCDHCHKQMFLGYKCKECKLITKIVFGACDICHKNMMRGKICKDCKFKCHRDCAGKAAAACCLPNEYVEVFIESLRDGSPNPSRRLLAPGSSPSSISDIGVLKPVMSVPVFTTVPPPPPDTSSSATSSCNSSTPSSPALVMMTSPASMATSPSPAPSPSPQIQVTQFTFPDVADDGFFMDSCADLDMHEYRSTSSDVDVVNTNTSNDSDKTLVDSNASERTLPERVDSMDSQDDPFGHNWDRQNSLSVALKEWDIPYEELQLAERIGIGRFGTVHKGHWHGDVAIKMVKMDPETNDDAQLSAFKLEVAMLRKTRHDNLVLFMGACMKPPHLAIVTSLCKGKTLYTQIHVMRDKFGLNKSVLVGSQVAQGMGYLHARGIIHKDLKTKNIFLEKERVVITDFGLFSVTRLCHENRKDQCLTIPSGWLCYLSPEIMRSLKAGNRHTNMDLPFTEESDVYAFGTVWYELLTGEWPFRRQPPESLIWQVGRGIKQSLSVIGLSKEVKDILLLCWAYHASNRPDFSKLLRTLERLPKKKLIRSPSHPIHLSRSAESVI